MAEAPPAYSDDADPQQYQGGDGEQGDPEKGRSSATVGGIKVEVGYFRSLEGILRIVAIVLAAIGLILIIADVFRSVGGWFFFVGFWFIIYNIIVMVIETCIPNVGIHKLIDCIILFAYAALWFLSGILNISFAIAHADALLGVASVFGLACGGICIALAIFALRTWQTKGDKNMGNIILF